MGIYANGEQSRTIHVQQIAGMKGNPKIEATVHGVFDHTQNLEREDFFSFNYSFTLTAPLCSMR